MTDQRVVAVYPGQPPTDDVPLKEWLARLVTNTNAALNGVSNRLDLYTEFLSSTLDEQTPTGLDTPMLVSWGPEFSDSPNIEVSAAGDITFLVGDTFIFEGFLQVARADQPSSVMMILYMTINDVSLPFVHAVTIENPWQYIPINFSYTLSAKSGDVVRIYAVRDSSGADDGGLRPFTPTSTAVPSVPSAALSIKRIRI